MDGLSRRWHELRIGIRKRLQPVEEPAISQRNLILANISSGTVNNFIGGNFFTGLLLLLQASDGIIGLIAMTGYVGNLLQVLSPLLLERFHSRKRLLILSRMVIYFFNIVVIALVPFLPYENRTKLVLIIAVLLLINLINAMTAPGFSVWHIKCVPEKDRAGYFTLNSILNGIVVFTAILFAGKIVDQFKASGHEMEGLLLFRGIALVLCAVDIFLLFRIKEYPNVLSGEAISLTTLLIRPFREKKYLISVATACLWSFAANIPGPYFTVYMLKDMGVSYFFLNLVNMFNIPILLFIAPLWQRQVNRISWFGTLTFAVSFFLPHYFILAFITKQTLFLYPIAVVYALLMAPGINLVFANMAYINLPEKDQTSFISFYATMNNLAALLGTLAGRQFIEATAGFRFPIFGIVMGNKQYILLLTAVLMIGVVIAIQALHRKALNMAAKSDTVPSDACGKE